MMWRGGHFGRLVCSIASSIEYCNPQSQQSLTFFVIFVTRNHHVSFDDFIAERSEVKSHTPFDAHSVHPLSPVHLYLFIDVAAKYGVSWDLSTEISTGYHIVVDKCVIDRLIITCL